MPELIAARIVQAVAAGLMVPASLSLLLASVPASGRAKAIGTWSALGALGAALGPVIGGSLVQVSWRWVFWSTCRSACSPRGDRAGGEGGEGSRRPRPPDLVGAALLSLAVGLVAFALVKGSEWGWVSPVPRGARRCRRLRLDGGLVLRRQHSPVIELGRAPVGHLRRRLAASFLFFAAFGAMVLGSVVFLTGVWH